MARSCLGRLLPTGDSIGHGIGHGAGRARHQPVLSFVTGLIVCGLVAAGTAPASVQSRTGPSAGQGGAFTTGSKDPLVDEINKQIRQGWKDNEVEPSSVAEESEWLRRVYLDIVGHVPPADEVEKFLADRDKAKRSKVIERLLDDPAYVRNWTTIWTNLAIGRQTPQRVSRSGMTRFFREAFARDRPWNEVVVDLVTAEGHFERNGAVNYLLAQMTMRDEGVQATAKTTRLFMGIQVQCTQCHNHPWVPEWKQDQFWQFNSFFRQARRVDHQRYDPEAGRRVDDYSELLSRDFEGPVYFEQRSGLMRVAYPTYFDKQIEDEPGLARREKLAELMIEGDEPWVARAMVNRMWGHFFGFGFTRPVDRADDFEVNAFKRCHWDVDE
jgi:hypothetical protein